MGGECGRRTVGVACLCSVLSGPPSRKPQRSPLVIWRHCHFACPAVNAACYVDPPLLTAGTSTFDRFLWSMQNIFIYTWSSLSIFSLVTSRFYIILGKPSHIVRLSNVVLCVFLVLIWPDVFAFKFVDPPGTIFGVTCKTTC